MYHILVNDRSQRLSTLQEYICSEKNDKQKEVEFIHIIPYAAYIKDQLRNPNAKLHNDVDGSFVVLGTKSIFENTNITEQVDLIRI